MTTGGGIVAVADFGVGNLHSVVGALRRVAPAARVVLAQDAATLARADKVILPGDGHFDSCMRAIEERDLRAVLLEAAATKPFWGICAGMQMLFEGSEEGELPGLGIFPGRIRKLPNGKSKIPHIGWNTTTITKPAHPMLCGIASGARFYFIHSYYAPRDDNTAATTTHGTVITNGAKTTPGTTTTTKQGAVITAISAKDNIFASQFHPEKSATPGEHLLKNFMAL